MSSSDRLLRVKAPVAGLLAVLVSCGGGGSEASAEEVVALEVPDWDVSGIAVAPHPVKHPDGLFALDVPTAGGASVHSVTRQHSGALAGAALRMRFRVETAGEVWPRNFPGSPSSLSMFFQRPGDNLSGSGAFETYRWYAKFAQLTPIRAGEFVITAPFSGNWNAVLTSTRLTNPAAFSEALANMSGGRIGFVLGGGDGLAHGVRATAPTRIVVHEFGVT